MHRVDYCEAQVLSCWIDISQTYRQFLSCSAFVWDLHYTHFKSLESPLILSDGQTETLYSTETLESELNNIAVLGLHYQ